VNHLCCHDGCTVDMTDAVRAACLEDRDREIQMTGASGIEVIVGHTADDDEHICKFPRPSE
jgi:hypothetical protein